MARTVSTSHLPKEPRERCALHTPCTLATCQLPKVLQECCALHILTSKCALRILVPQLHALFRHLNFQKGSDAEVFLTCWLRNMLRASLSLIRPKGTAPATLASPLFDPPGPQNIGKKQCFAFFLPFREPASSFF